MKRVVSKHDPWTKRGLLDPGEAAEYLADVLEEGSQEDFFMAVKDVAKARGIAQIAREPHLTRRSLDRILSAQGDPKLEDLKSVLNSVWESLEFERRRF